jgi:outer membrane protein TolC
LLSINVWNIGANLVQPLLRGGELRARQRAAQAAYEQALAGYRVSVLQALLNVADVLRSLEADAQTLAKRDEQAARAAEALRITRERFDAGGVSRLTVLDAERSWQQTELERAMATASRAADAASLLQALGGGESAAIGPVAQP